MLWCGDVHGNLEKVKAFLAYKPEIPHGFVGDYFDSYVASCSLVIETFEYIMSHDCVTLSGNHDNHYFKNATSNMICSGFRQNRDYVNLVEKYKNRLIGSYVDGPYLVTHAGVHPLLYRNFHDIKECSEWINHEFDFFKNAQPYTISRFDSRIFFIGSCRGGGSQWGGPFWLDYRFEKLANVNQIFGHSKSLKSGVKILKNKKTQVCIDTENWQCYNSQTHMVEDFFPKDREKERLQLEICY